jgi:2,3-bisphosphoglycerate-dependent phosphoglycerate mutase
MWRRKVYIILYIHLDILEVNIPTSVPLVYEFDENLHALRSYYLGDQAEIKRKMDAVAK